MLIGLPTALLPVQILWTNILTEGFMNFAFAFEPKEKDLMLRNPRTHGAAHMLNRELKLFIIGVGVISGSALILLYWLLYSVFGFPVDEARTLVFIALTVGTTLIAFALKDLRTPVYRINPFSNVYLVVSFALAIGGLLLALHFEPLSNLLSLAPVSLGIEIPVVLFVVLINLGGVELAKKWAFPRHSGA